MTKKILVETSKLLGNNSEGVRMTGTRKPKLVKPAPADKK